MPHLPPKRFKHTSIFGLKIRQLKFWGGRILYFWAKKNFKMSNFVQRSYFAFFWGKKISRHRNLQFSLHVNEMSLDNHISAPWYNTCYCIFIYQVVHSHNPKGLFTNNIIIGYYIQIFLCNAVIIWLNPIIPYVNCHNLITPQKWWRHLWTTPYLAH